MVQNPKIAIVGAGSIGCMVGGLLVHAGRNVKFLARSRMYDLMKEKGLKLTDYSGLDLHLSPSSFEVDDDPKLLLEADVVLVCVKSGATAEVAAMLAAHTKPSAVIVSLQNGVRNKEILLAALPNHDVRSGMVPFNVVETGSAQFHRGTSGAILVEAGSPDIAELISTNLLEVTACENMVDIQWGKLLINLTNALNALADIPLLEQISNRTWRKITADQATEALALMKKEGLSPVMPFPLPANLYPFVLRLPDLLFKRIAKRMLTIDPRAQTSMWTDLKRGKATEIDQLQGEIIRLGEKHGQPTPLNRDVYEKLIAAQERNEGPPGLPPKDFL